MSPLINLPFHGTVLCGIGMTSFQRCQCKWSWWWSWAQQRLANWVKLVALTQISRLAWSWARGEKKLPQRCRLLFRVKGRIGKGLATGMCWRIHFELCLLFSGLNKRSSRSKSSQFLCASPSSHWVEATFWAFSCITSSNSWSSSLPWQQCCIF